MLDASGDRVQFFQKRVSRLFVFLLGVRYWMEDGMADFSVFNLANVESNRVGSMAVSEY